ncbi:MAG TPA: hypothetical protein VLJ17_24830 [Xanthobacteraceae bacterium]|nr:hypothetical protein [Xanthobacteraceae bacterium]
MAKTEFKVVEDDDAGPFALKAPPEKQDVVAENMLMLALRALSQRAIAAIADLFTIVTVSSAWWLWASTPDPNVHQIVSLTVYALFVLAVNTIVRKL